MKKLPLLLLGCLFLSACVTTGTDDPFAESETVQNVAALGLAGRLMGGDWVNYGLAYLIYDPLAPNWEIHETRVREDVFHMQLRMKRHHKGGEGESMLILKRRAAQLQRELGYGSYRILDYSEGIDSQSMGARRYGEGSIQLVRR